MSEGEFTEAPSAATQVFSGELHRVRRGRQKRFATQPLPQPVRRPARVAVMLALAHKLQEAIDRGDLKDRAEVARRLGLTRARVTHLLHLLQLAPDLQEQVLELEAVDGVEPLSERALRAVALAGAWEAQRAAFRVLRHG